MSDNLQRYLPEYDDEAERAKLSRFSKEELLDMLVRSYKEKRVFAKDLGEQLEKLRRIEAIVREPSKLAQMPGIPSAEDLNRWINPQDEDQT